VLRKKLINNTDFPPPLFADMLLVEGLFSQRQTSTFGKVFNNNKATEPDHLLDRSTQNRFRGNVIVAVVCVSGEINFGGASWRSSRDGMKILILRGKPKTTFLLNNLA